MGKCTKSDNTIEFFPSTNGSSAVDHNLEIGDRIILTDSTNLTNSNKWNRHSYRSDKYYLCCEIYI